MKLALSASAIFVVLVIVLGAGIYSSALLPMAPSPPAAADVGPDDGAPAAAFTGTSAGCTEPDPTNPAGCLTPAAAWLYQQLQQRFGAEPTACWDAHAWNPRSDHPSGRACDVTIGRGGESPDEAARAHGWVVAEWLRSNASALHVSYVIWDGRIWSTARQAEGWRTYDGGGVYDVSTPTGGHYDHVHVSVAR